MYEKNKGFYENKVHLCSVACVEYYCRVNKIKIIFKNENVQEEKETCQLFEEINTNNNEKPDSINFKYDYNYDPMEDF